MPLTKLTLAVKPEIVRVAKQYARRHRTSVSATFSRVISALARHDQSRAVKVPRGSALEKLSGIVALPKGRTEDDVRLEALLEKYGLDEDAGRGR